MRINIPETIKSKKAKIAYILFFIIYIFDLGKQRVIGRFISWLPEFGWAVAAIIYFTKVQPTAKQVALLMLLAIIMMFCLGLLYYILKLDKLESIVSTRRNVIMNDIHKNVGKKREYF